MVKRTRLSLETAHGVVRIDTNDQMISQLGSLLQILHMAGMKNIEAAIGKDNSLSRLLPGPCQPGHFVPGHGAIVKAFRLRISKDFTKQLFLWTG